MPGAIKRWQRILTGTTPVQAQRLGYADAHIGKAIAELQAARKHIRAGKPRKAMRVIMGRAFNALIDAHVSSESAQYSESDWRAIADEKERTEAPDRIATDTDYSSSASPGGHNG